MALAQFCLGWYWSQRSADSQVGVDTAWSSIFSNDMATFGMLAAKAVHNVPVKVFLCQYIYYICVVNGFMR